MTKWKKELVNLKKGHWNKTKNESLKILRTSDSETMCAMLICQKEEGRKHVKEVMAQNFPSLENETEIQIPEAQWTPNRITLDSHIKTHYNSAIKS